MNIVLNIAAYVCLGINIWCTTERKLGMGSLKSVAVLTTTYSCFSANNIVATLSGLIKGSSSSSQQDHYSGDPEYRIGTRSCTTLDRAGVILYTAPCDYQNEPIRRWLRFLDRSEEPARGRGRWT